MSSWKKINTSQISLIAGILLLLFGAQLRLVDSFVLSSDTTRVLAQWSGPSSSSPDGVLRDIVVQTTSPRKTITPPNWLGWASLSVGIVLVAHGLLNRRRK